LLCQKSNFLQAVSQVNSFSSNSLPAAPILCRSSAHANSARPPPRMPARYPPAADSGRRALPGPPPPRWWTPPAARRPRLQDLQPRAAARQHRDHRNPGVRQFPDGISTGPCAWMRGIARSEPSHRLRVLPNQPPHSPGQRSRRSGQTSRRKEPDRRNFGMVLHVAREYDGFLVAPGRQRYHGEL